MNRQEILEQAEQFLDYASKRQSWSLSGTFQHWSRSKDFAMRDRQEIWLKVRQISDSDEQLA